MDGNESQGRIAIVKPNNIVYSEEINDYFSTTFNPSGTFHREINQKFYAIKDHLGSERVVISDIKEPSPNGSKFYTNNISVNNYYPYGSLMSDISRSSEQYRYGYNGKENDNEIAGKNATTDYGARTYANRLARFLSTDPLNNFYPGINSYNYAGNNPINFIDLFGLKPEKPPSNPESADNPNVTDDDGTWMWIPGGQGWTETLVVTETFPGRRNAFGEVPKGGNVNPADLGYAYWNSAWMGIVKSQTGGLLDPSESAGGQYGNLTRELTNNVANGIDAVEAATSPLSLVKGIGKTSIYVFKNADGLVYYVGKSIDVKRRAREHLRKSGWKNPDEILENLSDSDARLVEQVIIMHYEFKRNKGSLLNRINSIAKTNPMYKDIQKGYDILKANGIELK